MTRRYTRRATLASIASVAAAGCTSDEPRSFWDDPPSFDDASLDGATDAALPERPDPLPVTLSEQRADEFAARVETLLAPIPDGLDEALLPNGEIRQAILDARTSARDALSRMRETEFGLAAAEAAIDASAAAARGAGIWIHVSVDHDPDSLPLSPSSVSGDVRRVREAIPDVASSQAEGVVVYAPLEDWLFVGAPAPDGARDAIEFGATPLETGQAAADLEHSRTEAAVAEHLRDRYVSTLSDPEPTVDRLEAAIERLADDVREHFRSLYGDDVRDPLLHGPSVDDYLSRDVARDAPGADLLQREFRAYFRRGPWPGEEPAEPALQLRRTHDAFSRLDAFDAIRDRIDDGDDLFPRDAAEIEGARTRAIDRVEELSASRSPLDRWQAWTLVPEIGLADERLSSASGRRGYARAHTGYVWIATLAETVEDATERLDAALNP